MLSDPCEDLGCIHLSLGSPTHIMPTHALLHLTCSLPARKSIAGEATPVMKTCLREVWTTSGSQRFRMSYFCYIISPYFAMPLGPWGPPDLHIDLGQFITNPEPDCFGHVGDILEKNPLLFTTSWGWLIGGKGRWSISNWRSDQWRIYWPSRSEVAPPILEGINMWRLEPHLLGERIIIFL